MAWDSVPWFVGGGAEHSPEVARVLSYAAFGGAEGVVGSDDLLVREQPVPDGTVRVLPGACSILNRAAAQAYQAYVGRLPSADTVAVSPTDSLGGRSDLIVARVEDPFLAGEGWQEPDDPANAQYVFTRVIPDVPAGTTSVEELDLGYSAIALARVDLPASTGTITQNMITDLRSLVQPRRSEIVRIHNQTHADNRAQNTTFEPWPGAAVWQVDVPEWAVRAQIVAHNSGFRVTEDGTGGNVWGKFRVRLGDQTTENVTYNFSAPAGHGAIDTAAFTVAGDMYLPKAQRGTSQTLQWEANRDGGDAGSYVETGYGQVVAFTVIFYEAPDAQGWEQ